MAYTQKEISDFEAKDMRISFLSVYSSERNNGATPEEAKKTAIQTVKEIFELYNSDQILAGKMGVNDNANKEAQIASSFDKDDEVDIKDIPF